MAAKKSHGDGSAYEYPKGSGRWFAQITIESKAVRRRANSEQAANERLRELQELKRGRVDVHSGRQSVQSWMGVFYEQKVRLRKLHTRSANSILDAIERYIVPKLGGQRLCDVRPTHIQAALDDIYREIQEAGRYDGARTVHAIATVLKEAFALAKGKKLILDDPYSGIVLPKYKRKKIEPLDDAQLRAFLDAAAGRLDKRKRYTTADGKRKRLPPIDPRLAALWYSYALLGWRRGEGLGARWAAIDWEKRTILIDQQVQRITNAEGSQEVVVSAPKTEDSTRLLPLTRRLYALYRARWDDSQAERELRGWSIDTLIFPSQVGTPIWPDNLETMFRRIRDAAGLPATFKLHHLRHTLATLVDESGATEALKESILGHSAKTQSGKYTHGRVEAMRAVLQVIEDRILGAAEKEQEDTGT